MQKRRSIELNSLIFIAIAVIVSAIYSQTIDAPFAFDDTHKIEENRHIRLTDLSPISIVMAGFKSSKTRPLAFASFALNYYFGQNNPAGYHIVNILIHLLAGFFLYLFIKTTLRTPPLQGLFQHPTLIAFLSAVFWLVHPVQTQSVTYVIQRMNSLASMLFVLAFWLYIKGRLMDGDRKEWLWYAGSALSWLASLGCKQITVTLPLFIFFYEWYFFQNLDKNWMRRNLKWVVSIVVFLAILALIYMDFNPAQKLSRFHDLSRNEFTVAQRALTQLRVVVYYISLLLYPHPSRLNLDYDFPLSLSLINPITTLFSLILILFLVVLGTWLARKQRLISFCIFWFLGNLVIESSIIPLAIIFEHRLYLPSMLVSLALVVMGYRFIKFRGLSVAIACALILLLSYWTFERNKVWEDEIALWADVVKKSPNKARPYSNLALAQARQNMPAMARENYLKAIKLDPNFFEAHFNLGSLLEEQGKVDEAIKYYRQAIKINPQYVKGYNFLGMTYLKQNKTQQAIDQFRTALQIDPNFARGHNNLGLAMAKNGNIHEAIIHYKKALRIDFNLPETHLNLGNALVQQGQTEQGIRHIRKALELKANYIEAHNNLGGFLLAQGKIDEALKHFKKVLNINPAMVEAHNNIGIIFMHKGKISEAIYHFQEAVRINPDFEMAQDNLRRAMAIQQTNLNGELARIQSELKNRSDDPVLNYAMGNLHLSGGELNSAIGQYRKAIALQPDFPQALNNLAMAYTFTGQHDRALEVFQKLIALQPDNAANYYNAAILYALQNKETEALDWLKKAVDKGYDNWDLIKTDKDLDNIRDSEGYRELIEGH